MIDAFVEQLELQELGFGRVVAAVEGRPGYHPAALLKLYIYGDLNRILSSRALERETQRNIEVMWLLKKLTPDHKTIADFRRDHPKALQGVFREFIVLCKELELFGAGIIAVDGSAAKSGGILRPLYCLKFLAVNRSQRNYRSAKTGKGAQRD